MSHEWQKNDDFPIVKRSKLGFAEIGGIGQIVYKTVKYKKYLYQYHEIDYDFTGWMYRPLYDEIPTCSEDYGLTGTEILASICNLAKEYNSYNRKTHADLIAQWCEDNFHPYDIDVLYETYRKLDKDEERSERPNIYDGFFKASDFLRDMQNVYCVFSFYYAYVELCNGNPLMAYNLHEEVMYFDTLPFFEEYKYRDWKPYVPPTNEELNSNVNILEEMMKEAKEEPKNNLIPIEEIEFFRKNVLRDKKKIYQLVCDMIPDINMAIKFDAKKCQAEFTANVHSVFDICWYTIARMVASHAPSMDENVNTNKMSWDQKNIGVCINCGDFFARKSNRQQYCDSDECKRACNRNRQRKFQRRKREKIE